MGGEPQAALPLDELEALLAEEPFEEPLDEEPPDEEDPDDEPPEDPDEDGVLDEDADAAAGVFESEELDEDEESEPDEVEEVALSDPVLPFERESVR